jgi:hypothetical protein
MSVANAEPAPAALLNGKPARRSAAPPQSGIATTAAE